MSSKAQAAIGITNTVALGQVEHHCAVEHSVPQVQKRKSVRHSYTGYDENILRILQKVSTDEHYGEGRELRARVPRTMPKLLAKAESNVFRPEGTLVAHIHEHSAAINHISISPDHVFFVTCSDDGTIKIWDSSKLERNVANRARLTYRGLTGSKVKTTCFLEQSYTVAAAADSGAIHIIKIECTRNQTKATIYGTTHTVNQYQLPANETAIWMEQLYFRYTIHSVSRHE